MQNKCIFKIKQTNVPQCIDRYLMCLSQDIVHIKRQRPGYQSNLFIFILPSNQSTSQHIIDLNIHLVNQLILGYSTSLSLFFDFIQSSINYSQDLVLFHIFLSSNISPQLIYSTKQNKIHTHTKEPKNTRGSFCRTIHYRFYSVVTNLCDPRCTYLGCAKNLKRIQNSFIVFPLDKKAQLNL